MNNLILKTWQINLDFIVKQLLRKNLKIVDFILRKLCILVAWRQEKASYYVNIFAYFWGILKLMWHLNQIRFLIGLDKKNSSFVSESRDFGSQFIYCLLQSPVERFSCSLGLSQCTHLNFWEWGRASAPQHPRRPLGSVQEDNPCLVQWLWGLKKDGMSGEGLSSGNIEEHLQPPSVWRQGTGDRLPFHHWGTR